MAGIDKTYGSKEQYKQLRQFWIDTYDEQIRLFDEAIWLYPFSAFDDFPKIEITPEFLKVHTDDIDEFPEDTDNYPLWNTSSTFDVWLSKNCKLDFVQKRLAEQQYDSYWLGFKYQNLLNFDHKPHLIQIDIKHFGNDDSIYFYKDIDKDSIETLDKLIVFGSTWFFQILNDAKQTLNNFVKPSIQLDINFNYFGLNLKHSNKTLYLLDSDGNVIDTIDDIIQFEDLKIPEIKYARSFKEAIDYEPHEIYFSNTDEIIAMADFEDYETNSVQRCAMSALDKYLYELIKN